VTANRARHRPGMGTTAGARRCLQRSGLRGRGRELGRAPAPVRKRRPQRLGPLNPSRRPAQAAPRCPPNLQGPWVARGGGLGGRPAGRTIPSALCTAARPPEDRPPRCRATGPAGRPPGPPPPPDPPAGRCLAVPPAIRFTRTGTGTGTGTGTDTAAARCIQHWWLRGRGRGRAPAPVRTPRRLGASSAGGYGDGDGDSNRHVHRERNEHPWPCRCPWPTPSSFPYPTPFAGASSGGGYRDGNNHAYGLDGRGADRFRGRDGSVATRSPMPLPWSLPWSWRWSDPSSCVAEAAGHGAWPGGTIPMRSIFLCRP